MRPNVPAGDLVPGAGQHLQLCLSSGPQGGGSDSRGDLGGLLYYPRETNQVNITIIIRDINNEGVWSPGRVRAHPQNNSGFLSQF